MQRAGAAGAQWVGEYRRVLGEAGVGEPGSAAYGRLMQLYVPFIRLITFKVPPRPAPQRAQMHARPALLPGPSPDLPHRRLCWGSGGQRACTRLHLLGPLRLWMAAASAQVPDKAECHHLVIRVLLTMKPRSPSREAPTPIITLETWIKGSIVDMIHSVCGTGNQPVAQLRGQ